MVSPNEKSITRIEEKFVGLNLNLVPLMSNGSTTDVEEQSFQLYLL